MSETKWTPAPWEYVKLSHGSVYIRSLVDGVDGYLADVFLSRPGECKANARLIAAAPELYEALLGAIDLIEIMSPIEGDEVRKGRAALAKARGEG